MKNDDFSSLSTFSQQNAESTVLDTLDFVDLDSAFEKRNFSVEVRFLLSQSPSVDPALTFIVSPVPGIAFEDCSADLPILTLPEM